MSSEQENQSNFDNRHDTPIEVTLLDKQTGQLAPGLKGFSTWWWTEGNGSCDCNRRLSFGGKVEDNEPCVSERYLVHCVNPLLPGYTIADFNKEYK